MPHDHHNHNHNHHHGTKNLALAFFLNTAFALIELAGGFFTNSVAIMSDALHDLGDSISLGTAWYFQKKSAASRSESYTYGYKRFVLIGAFINSIVLIVGSVIVIREAVERLWHPEPADPQGMLVLALLGIIVNGAAMLRLKKGGSMNEKVVALHFLEDVLGWVAVLIGAVIMMFTEVPWLDPVLSILISAYVLFNVYSNIKPALRIVLQGMPQGVSEQSVKQKILEQPGIMNVHDFHLWTMDGDHHILSVHVVMNTNMDLKEAEVIKEKIKISLSELHITHATIEMEFAPEHCTQKDC